MENRYDIVVIGGGLVGASFACALASSSLKIAIVEAHQFGAEQHPGFDDRSVALSWGSRTLFEHAGVWERIAPCATPINKIHISEQGRFGVTRLSAKEEKVPALGYVVETRELGSRLYQHLESAANVDFYCPAELIDFEQRAEHVCLRLQAGDAGETELQTRLLVAADGIQSRVREQLGIPVQTREYDQTAIICNVTPQFPHQNVAWERFTSGGPVAFLPLGDFADSDGRSHPRYSVVWTVNREHADEVMALDDDRFLQQLEDHIGLRLGHLQHVGRRVPYPLSLVYAAQCTDTRVALMGNAAHTLHPVAGQGFNLGLRDAAVLAEQVLIAQAGGTDIGEQSVLEQYRTVRDADHKRTIRFTDTLARVFTLDFLPVRILRSLGLVASDSVPGIKSLIARRAMGLANRLPRFRL